MTWSSDHIKWLINNGKRITTVDGTVVDVWELRHKKDDKVLSSWAKHFRNHYCLDHQIDYYRKGYKYSRKDYLNTIKFPDPQKAPGPSVRAGDFGEVLVADYLEYLCNYWVPRTRYGNKTVRNESTKGCDVIGFFMSNEDLPCPEDRLAIFEVKTQFSGKTAKKRLQDAVNDSAKDIVRKAESLNAIRQRLYESNELEDADKIDRFQNEVDCPYNEVYGAVALFDNVFFDDHLISLTDASSHPRSNCLTLLVIKGDEMMKLVNELYRRGADEA